MVRMRLQDGENEVVRFVENEVVRFGENEVVRCVENEVERCGENEVVTLGPMIDLMMGRWSTSFRKQTEVLWLFLFFTWSRDC